MAGFSVDGTGQKVMFADNVDFSGAATPTGQFTTNGQLLIGSTIAPHITIGSLSSSDGSVTITNGSGTISLQVAGGTTTLKTITGNSGGPIAPSAGNFNILTANSTVKFAGTAATLTQDFNLTNLILGSSASSITSANQNVGLGSLVLGNLTSGSGNTCIGYGAGNQLTSPINNTLIGDGTGNLITTSPSNTAVGTGALGFLTTGSGLNVAIGNFSLNKITTGSSNTCIGYNAGFSYTGSEANNICIGAATVGTLGESTTTRIGVQGTQNACFIAGISGVTVSNTTMVTQNSSTGQLGVVTSVPIANGGTNATSFTQSNGIVTYNGTSLVNYAGPQISSGGVQTNTSQPAFQAHLSTNAGGVTGDGTDYKIVFDTVDYDQGSHYNSSTGVYTFATAGVYQINVEYFVYVSSGASTSTVMNGYVLINGATNRRIADNNPNSLGLLVGQEFIITQSFAYKAAANDTMEVHVVVANGTKNIGVAGGTQACRFGGYLVC